MSVTRAESRTYHFHGGGNACNDIVVGAPLQTREHCTVDTSLIVIRNLLPLDHTLHTSAEEDDP